MLFRFMLPQFLHLSLYLHGIVPCASASRFFLTDHHTSNLGVAYRCLLWYTTNRQLSGCLLVVEQKHVASKRGDTLTILDRIERIEVLPVSRERVWDAITKPEQFSQWFGIVRDMDFRVGGEINFTWDNGRSPYPGIIEAIEPPHRFAFRWYSYAIGHPELKLAPTSSTLVEFTLEEIAEGTQLTLVESGFASLPEAIQAAQAYQDNHEGWQVGLTGLRTYLQSQVSAT